MNPLPVASRAAPVPAGTKGSPLLERLRQAARERGDSAPTADALVSWARAFILFHDKRHPSELGLAEATHFLEHVVKTAAIQAAGRWRTQRDGQVPQAAAEGQGPQRRPSRRLWTHPAVQLRMSETMGRRT